jgi:hypothetical protein
MDGRLKSHWATTVGLHSSSILRTVTLPVPLRVELCPGADGVAAVAAAWNLSACNDPIQRTSRRSGLGVIRRPIRIYFAKLLGVPDDRNASPTFTRSFARVLAAVKFEPVWAAQWVLTNH